MNWVIVALTCLSNVFVVLSYLSLRHRLYLLELDLRQAIENAKIEKDELDHRQNLLTRLSEVQNARFSRLTRG